MSSNRKSAAFSHVEFLVIAAVLILLGAVVLPRYRQADAASDYAKVLDNFGQIAAALEAYRADGTEYPETDFGVAEAVTRRSILRLTTPVAYLPALPRSPYQEHFATPAGPKIGEALNTALYTRQWIVSGGIDPNFQSDAISYAFGGRPVPGMVPFFRGAEWELKSVGPDGIDDRSSRAPGYGNGARVYDPTNGIASRGDIVWFSNIQLSKLPSPAGAKPGS